MASQSKQVKGKRGRPKKPERRPPYEKQVKEFTKFVLIREFNNRLKELKNREVRKWRGWPSKRQWDVKFPSGPSTMPEKKYTWLLGYEQGKEDCFSIFGALIEEGAISVNTQQIRRELVELAKTRPEDIPPLAEELRPLLKLLGLTEEQNRENVAKGMRDEAHEMLAELPDPYKPKFEGREMEPLRWLHETLSSYNTPEHWPTVTDVCERLGWTKQDLCSRLDLAKEHRIINEWGMPMLGKKRVLTFDL